jgi:hypothetical protein
MNRQISKDTLEHYFDAVEFAVRGYFPIDSGVVSSLHEIMRLALKGYELESAGQDASENNISMGPRSVPQLGIR